jgi:glycosyltransferase involved in cell wall biosynthesis
MKIISVVIPALNEEIGIGPVLREIPIAKLKQQGYEVEVLVIDNGSHDQTPHIARRHGANVIVQPIRGYGNAYKAGFANAHGHIIATGDADLTYPFEILPEVIAKMEAEDLDFINTDRLSMLQGGVMSASHQFGNWMLTTATKTLFGWPYKDSQSGMWIFKRKIWDHLDVRSSGMPFSQELKIEAFLRGFHCAEIPIEYRTRAGQEKLNTVMDGIGNVTHLARKRIALGTRTRSQRPHVEEKEHFRAVETAN